MQKGLDARLCASVAGVAVGFDDGKRFSLHGIGEEVEVEAVRAARVVAAIQAVDAARAADLVGGAQDPLAVAPVHVLERGHGFVDRITVEGNADGSLFPQDGGHIGIEDRVVDRVGAAQHNHGRNRVRLAEIQRPPSDFPAGVLELRLRPGGPLVRTFPVLAGASSLVGELLAAGEKRSRFQILHAQVDHWGEHAGRGGLLEVPAQQIGTGLRDGAGDGVRLAVHPGQAADHR